MPAPLTDFLAGYVSGAVGIAIGNPFDIIKVKLQNGSVDVHHLTGTDELVVNAAAQAAEIPRINAGLRPLSIDFKYVQSLLHGVAAPILGYGALNALLFASYSISMQSFSTYMPSMPDVGRIFASGTIAGLSTFVISAPTEIIKCRTQLTHEGLATTTGHQLEKSSWTVAKEIYRHEGPLGFFKGGMVTGFRDGFGYGVYFWAYGVGKNWKIIEEETSIQHAIHLLIAGGVAGCATWASIFPLDVVKTRYQAQQEHNVPASERYKSSWDCAKRTFVEGGIQAFFRGMKVTMIRAFIVNAVQFGTYEWMVKIIESS
ncbi:mitochondrial carrier domain-containing protein [Lipomyces arxii]|uniref:mitochondrial carrier domain-containing protein n=1 Tax=Lipomyces arxii TaxID=56418 RepID=UPI0034CF0741